jgi:hypothetical protein
VSFSIARIIYKLDIHLIKYTILNH